MKTLSILKALPLVGLLAMGLALVPAVSMADKYDRGHGEDKYQKHDGGKSHHESHHDDGHHKDGGHKNVYVVGYDRYRRYPHRHVHKHHGHRPADVVVVHDHYDDYDPLRLMLGLHFDNIDIIYRDY